MSLETFERQGKSERKWLRGGGLTLGKITTQRIHNGKISNEKPAPENTEAGLI